MTNLSVNPMRGQGIPLAVPDDVLQEGRDEAARKEQARRLKARVIAQSVEAGQNNRSFQFDSSEVRTIMIDDAPWFVATDVCAALGISNSRDALLKLDDDEKGVALTDTLGGKQSLAIVNESGLYTLVLRCRDAVKPGTVPHRFRKWVTGEVLPAIRKTGSYGNPERTRLAHALATEVAAAVAQSVFESVLVGNDDWRRGYWTFHMAYDSNGKQTRPYVKKAESGAITATLPQLTKLVTAPDWICRADELSALATACIQRLEKKTRGSL